jgi:hypothetical protein
MSRARNRIASIIGLGALGLGACSLFTDLNDLGGDASSAIDGALDTNASDASDAGDEPQYADVAPPVTCDAAATTCQPAAPSGWNGPLAFYEGDSGFPTCPAPLFQQVKGYEGLDVVAPTCSACGCATQTPTCKLQVTGYNASSTCAGSSCGTGLAATGCLQMQGIACGGEESIIIAGATGTATCTTSGGQTTNAPAKWSTEVLGCVEPPNAIVPADCAAGLVCVPAPLAPFGAKMCVTHVGDMACPSPYLAKHGFFVNASDTRGCTPCGCNVAGAPCKDLTLDVATGGTCLNPMAASTGSCIVVPGQLFVSSSATPPTLSCTFDGGAPTGTLAPGSPDTACCLP